MGGREGGLGFEREAPRVGGGGWKGLKGGEGEIQLGHCDWIEF